MPARNKGAQQFGERLKGEVYLRRPGAYGVAFDEMNRVLVIEVESGLFLPGGGLHDGESTELALRREILEETGFEIEIAGELGCANQFVTSVREGTSFNKIGAFFLVELKNQVSAPWETDHSLLWLTADEAMARLRDDNHRWALERAITTKHAQDRKKDPWARLSGR